jgi:8-oxo-dGTP pyrophosphatase MutT (NUDIX family)
MHDFITSLKTELSKGLPGTEIQWQMASSDRMRKNFPRIPGKDAREAAVLVLMFRTEGSIHTLLMQRPEYDGVHGGQISFPGGKKEPADSDLVQTALREANEETGINPRNVSIIGNLTPLFIPVSNMLVTPVIGWTDKKPDFKFLSEEVVFLIDCDLNTLLNPLIVKIKPFEIRGELLNVKYFDYHDHVIWGATAMILHELLVIIRKSGINVLE